MAVRTVGIRVHGRVQGVGYRAFLRAEAAAHGLAGWVRNRRDGTVEAELTGTGAAIEAVLSLARRGPPSARVTDVEVTESAATDSTGMSVRPTV